MISNNLCRVILFALCCTILSAAAPAVLAQDSNPIPAVTDNFDTELYLLLASNERPGEGQIPASLDSVIKQLRGTLTFKNYSLAATLLNRVKSGGSLSLTWIGGPLRAPSNAVASSPTFSQLSIGQLRASENAGGTIVQIQRFSFGARVPIQTGTNIAPSGTNSAPVIAYEHLGISSDFSVRPDQPTIVGTLTVGSTGDAIIVVICARRVQR
jgi:hypothetical protein